ncbi:MAG: asparagine synthase (glutamine-hydrolyzing) [Chitinophagales bacterium]|nr:asparagine synthase (glutamine-hydrolyzing) [Chitinophagales bacterium]
MCGIAGYVDKNALKPDAIASVQNMQQWLSHRGPDGEGEYKARQLYLVMKRLSIIDIDGGQQPLYNEDNSIVLIANGEVYNYIELTEDLQKKGHQFQTHSDCETIIHLYEEYGIDCVKYLRGMFAFALYDIAKNKLIIGRDHMGEKPIYLYQTEDSIFFASELKALLASKAIPFELEPDSLNLYLHYRYVPEPLTPIKGIRKLPAGCLLEIDLNQWLLKETKYWRIEDANPIHGNPESILKEELETIGRLTVRSDRPIGIALSGGLDSSLIAKLAATYSNNEIHAFTVGYPGYPDYDERKEAKELAEQLGIKFSDIELSTDEMVKQFKAVTIACDDPIADISSYGYFSVMKLAHQKDVPVVFLGQGPDELFWGYEWVKEAYEESIKKKNLLHKGWLAFPYYLRFRLPESMSLGFLKEWLYDLGGFNSSYVYFKSLLKNKDNHLVFYDVDPNFQTMQEVKKLLHGSKIEHVSHEQAAPYISTFDKSHNVDVLITKLICETYLQENGIVQGDRLSMACSVEVRLPLIDHVFVEKVIGLRKTKSDFNEAPKFWFRQTLKHFLSPDIINRKKRPFSPPVDEWRNKLLEVYEEDLVDGYLIKNSYISKEGLSAIMKKSKKDFKLRILLYQILVFNCWCSEMEKIATGETTWQAFSKMLL